tara:strand:+ start:452 stop:616 length:165 start_codon:yes stop_codon:yes gene_type:complete
MTKEEKQEKENLKKELFDDPTWSVMVDPQYPLKVSRYNYLVMKEVNSLLKLDES